MKYNVIKEDGTIMKTFDTYEAAERYYNMMNREHANIKYRAATAARL